MGSGDKPGLEGRRGEIQALRQQGAEHPPEAGHVGLLRLGEIARRGRTQEKAEHATNMDGGKRHTGRVGRVLQPGHEGGRGRFQPLVKARLLHGRQRGQTRRRRQRIAGQRSGLIDRTGGRHLRHQIRPAAVGADRQPATDHLAQRDQVGSHAKTRLGATQRNPKAGHHLVENQQRTVPVAHPAQAFQKPRLRQHAAHIARHRLDDHRRNISAATGEQSLHRGQIVIRRRQRQRRQFRRHARGAGHAKRERARTRVHQQAVGVTVVTTRELDQQLATGGGTRQTNRAHGRLGAGIDQPDLLHAGHQPAQRLGQLHLGPGRRTKRQAARSSGLYRLHHGRRGVAQDHRAPGADVVDVGRAVHVAQARAVGLGNERRLPANGAKRPHRRVHATRNDGQGALEKLPRMLHVLVHQLSFHKVARARAAASLSTSGPNRALPTARASAPAATNGAALSARMPPMHTMGQPRLDRAARSSSRLA